MKLFKTAFSIRTVLVLFVATNTVYALMLLWTIPMVSQMAGGMQLPDMSPLGYDQQYIESFLHELGSEGRKAYLYRQLPLDMLYPLLFGITYSLLLAWLFSKMRLLDSSWTNLCFIPLFAGLMDYAENIGIIMMLNSVSNPSETLVVTTNYFTIAKSLLTTIYFTALLVTFAFYLFRRARN